MALTNPFRYHKTITWTAPDEATAIELEQALKAWAPHTQGSAARALLLHQRADMLHAVAAIDRMLGLERGKQ